jgi:hypothetical protein
MDQEAIMAERFPPVKINFASVDVVGVPGLCLIAIVIAIAMEFPEARWLLLGGLAGGAVLAVFRFFRGSKPMRARITRVLNGPPSPSPPA